MVRGSGRDGGNLTDRWSGGDYWFTGVLGTVCMSNFIDCTIISVLGAPIKRDLGLNDLQLGLMGGLADAA